MTTFLPMIAVLVLIGTVALMTAIAALRGPPRRDEIPLLIERKHCRR